MSKSQTITAEKSGLPPVHPGEFLRDELEELGLSARELATELNIPANRLTEIIAGRRAVTADTALRLGRYFGGGADLWMRLQARYDLITTEAEKGEEIKRSVKQRAA